MELLFSFLRFIGRQFSLFLPLNIERFVRRIRRELYSGFIAGRLKQSGALFEGSVNLVGGNYITIGNDSLIGENVRLWAWDSFKGHKFTPLIEIGSRTAINSGCMLSCINHIKIGNDVGIASNCVIIDNTHGDFRDHKFTFNNNPDIPDVFLEGVHERVPFSRGPVIIEDGVHLGEGVVIMPGVVIGHHSIISAHAVVTKKIPPYSIVAGDPATVLMSFGKKK